MEANVSNQINQPTQVFHQIPYDLLFVHLSTRCQIAIFSTLKRRRALNLSEYQSSYPNLPPKIQKKIIYKVIFLKYAFTTVFFKVIHTIFPPKVNTSTKFVVFSRNSFWQTIEQGAYLS